MQAIPLLDGQRVTPLPKRQLLILCILKFSEAVSSFLIFPFVNDMIVHIGVTDDPRKVGYYSGFIESLFFLAQFCTVLYWGSLSDRIGRRPVLLMGLTGVVLSSIMFGLSTSFPMMALARGISGVLNGNAPVIKSAIGETTDPTNESLAFSLLGLCWALASLVAPIIGGFLARPAEHFPNLYIPGLDLIFPSLKDIDMKDWFGSVELFGIKLFVVYPYLLPCLGGAAVTLAAFIGGLFCLEETLPDIVNKKHEEDLARTGESRRLDYGTMTLSADGTISDGEDDEEGFNSPVFPHSRSSSSTLTLIIDDDDDDHNDHRIHCENCLGFESNEDEMMCPIHSKAATLVDPFLSRSHSRDSSHSPLKSAQHHSPTPPIKTALRRTPRSAFPSPPPPPPPPPLNRVLRLKPVQTVLISYVLFALIGIALEAIWVLWLFTPVEHGGIGLNTREIATTLLMTGILSAFLALVIFPPVQRRTGTLKIYWACLICDFAMCFGFCFVGLLARWESSIEDQAASFLGGTQSSTLWSFWRIPARGAMRVFSGEKDGERVVTWTGVWIMIVLKSCGEIAYSCTNLLINSSAPTRSSLGSINGVAQMIASLMRACGPFGFTSLFALTMSKNLLGGQLIWICLAFVAGLAVVAGFKIVEWEGCEAERSLLLDESVVDREP